ncbi:MAG TPA: hypothetical protein VGI79_18240 [Caulobacteraceae bacterium]|jgi:hypothetical protein
MHFGKTCVGLVAAFVLNFAAPALSAPHAQSPAQAEGVFADWLDAAYAVSSLQAGPMTRWDRQDLAVWSVRREQKADRLKILLDRAAAGRLSAQDGRALARMRQVLADAPTTPAASTGDDSAIQCDRATNPVLDRPALSAALYGCFERYGNHISFEGHTIARTTALELLQELDSSARRKALFDALAPLWTRINAGDEPASPYRRLIGLASAEARAHGGSAIDHAAKTLGETPDQVEAQLVAMLDAWRAANPGPAVEPWDYWNHYASGVRSLDQLIPPRRIQPLSDRYYRDLGVDLNGLGVISDLGVRPGKAPVAYTDFVRIGRQGPHGWRPAAVRVSANVEHGGLFVLNEIVHEDGHAAHMMAVRARPAYFDLGDELFLEAFADVTSWSVAEPAWQRRYLGRSVDGATAQRALLASVMLDAAWGLFELRMLRDPAADPNVVWIEITSRYLNIRPHPDIAWWALRVQMVDQPGYMINYGLGAMVTADLRDRFRRKVGPFDAGNLRWYPYAADHLLKFGAAVETPQLLDDFLGRPVSIEPLLAQIARAGSARSMLNSRQEY